MSPLLGRSLLACLVFALAARADGPDKKGVDAKRAEVIEKASLTQQQLRREFDDWKAVLLRLAQRLERGEDPADRKRAAALRDLLKQVSDRRTEERYLKLIEQLKSRDAAMIAGLAEALATSAELRKDLKDFRTRLLSDDALRKAFEVRLAGERAESDLPPARRREWMRARRDAVLQLELAANKGDDKLTAPLRKIGESLGKRGERERLDRELEGALRALAETRALTAEAEESWKVGLKALKDAGVSREVLGKLEAAQVALFAPLDKGAWAPLEKELSQVRKDLDDPDAARKALDRAQARWSQLLGRLRGEEPIPTVVALAFRLLRLEQSQEQQSTTLTKVRDGLIKSLLDP